MKKPEKQFRILIERIRSDNNSTVGKMYFNGDLQCYTLEDGHHDKKILGRTRIAQGVYILSLRKYGGKHKKYAKKYKGGPFLKHIGMIELNDVPDFTDILIHVGNSHHDTAGCVLVGDIYKKTQDGFHLYHSRHSYEKIYPEISKMIASGGKVTLQIIDKDRPN